MILLALLCALPVMGSRYNREADFSVVHTNSGNLKGFSKLVFGKEVYAFLGVPFAEPPVGALRFKKPVPISPWTGTRSADTLGNSCVQEPYLYFPGFEGEEMWNPNTNISEDCLTLNIWVPAKFRRGTDRAPVLLWLYGGGYMTGTATLDIYDADILAAENDIIVITANYRVGSFGFLYLGNDEAPGNQGLWDQALALQWIKDNIGNFGGDPDMITVAGESAGGGSASVHLFSPVTQHLIKRAIMQSGTVNAPWSYITQEKARKNAHTLIDDCGCDSSRLADDLSGVMQCMRAFPASQISVLQWNSYGGIMDFPSAPTIDGIFIPKDPLKMLQDGEFKHAEILLGSNKDEGTYFILYDFLDYFSRDDSKTTLTLEQYHTILNTIFKDRPELERSVIWAEYSDRNELNSSSINTQLLNDVVSDYFFVCPTNYFAEHYSRRNLPVYYYFFTQRTSSNPWGEWMGVMHGDEIEYVFGHLLNQSLSYTPLERNLSYKIMKQYANFVKTGQPLMDGSSDYWPTYNCNTREYYIWDADEEGIGSGPHTQRCAFWNQYMPKLQQSLLSKR